MSKMVGSVPTKTPDWVSALALEDPAGRDPDEVAVLVEDEASPGGIPGFLQDRRRLGIILELAGGLLIILGWIGAYYSQGVVAPGPRYTVVYADPLIYLVVGCAGGLALVIVGTALILGAQLEQLGAAISGSHRTGIGEGS